MRNLKALSFVALLALIGCAPFAVQLEHTYLTTTDFAHAAYVGYTNWYVMATNGAPQARMEQIEADRLKVKNARMDYAATVGVLDDARAAYVTNSALKPFLQATLQTAIDKSSNIVWLVNFIKQH